MTLRRKSLVVALATLAISACVTAIIVVVKLVSSDDSGKAIAGLILLGVFFGVFLSVMSYVLQKAARSMQTERNENHWPKSGDALVALAFAYSVCAPSAGLACPHNAGSVTEILQNPVGLLILVALAILTRDIYKRIKSRS